MLRQVAEGVLIHESEFCQSNAVVVHGRPACCSSTPGYTAPKWPASRTTCPMRARLSWRASRRILIGITCFGTPGSARRPVTAPLAARNTVRALLSGPHWKDSIAGWIPPDIAGQLSWDLFGLITGLPAEMAQIPWDGPEVRIVEHQAHAPGHAALLIEERGVLVAGDMLSDVLIPMLDLNGTADPIEDYLAALRLLADVAGDADVLVPGHGSIGGADQVHARIDQDRAYVHALRDAGVPSDPRVGPSAKDGWDWVAGVHARQLQGLARRSERGGTPGS